MTTITKIFVACIFIMFSVIACPFAVPCALGGTASELSVTVRAVSVAPKFIVYLGGGANIQPPAPIGNGGGVPMISLSGGSAFLAGEVSSKDPGTKLLRITFRVQNKAQDSTSFKIGDVKLVIGTQKWDDFIAVGYDTQLCAMGDVDRQKVKKIVVTLPPGGAKQLSYIFPIAHTGLDQAELRVSDSPPATFKVEAR